MKNFTYLLSAFLISIGMVHAQDIHFSAMDYSPLTLNPGLAGTSHDLYATVNYRSQWNAVASPYKTVAAGAAMRVTGGKPRSKGKLSVGINFFNDVAGTNKITTSRLGLVVAYQLKLNEKNYLSLGLQGSYGNRSINTGKGRWGSQYDGLHYNSSIASGEDFGMPKFSYFDANTGLVYTHQSINNSPNNNGTIIKIGLAAYHVNQPGYSFLQNKAEQLHMRLSTFVMAQIGIKDKKMALEPQLIVQFQGPSIETLLGTDFRVFLGDSRMKSSKTSLALGLYWRNQDALMTRFSVRFYGVDVGAVYDFNIFNGLKSLSHAKGAFELFLSYAMNFSGHQAKSMF